MGRKNKGRCMTKYPSRLLTTLALTVSSLSLISCGGSSSSSSAPRVSGITVPTSQTPAIPNFVANEFPTSASLKNLCQVVRTDRDLDGNRRPDQQGELLHELFWLRSWMNETYLYFDQVTDRNPNGFTDVEAYFDELIVSPPTDRFSFLQTTEDFETRSSGAPTFGYGASFTVLSNDLPRDWRVSFTQDQSPAATGGLTRGARILKIDGEDFVNGNSQAEVNAIVAGLFPTSVGESHSFELRYPDGSEREIRIESTSLSIEPVNLVDVIERGDQKVGYLHYNSFGPRTGEGQLIDAFERFSDEQIDELVLDLRYNGGGLLFLAAQLGYMIAGTQSANQVFYSQEFNSRDPGRNPLTGDRVSPINFQTESIGFLDDVPAGQALPTVNLDRVFVLTTGRSCSASEAIINGLIGIGVEAVQIGTRTCGKATGQIPTDNCGTTFIPLHFRGVNANGFGDYDGGFAPGEMTGSAGPVITGCEVSDDLSSPLGDTSEAQFSAALNFAETGTCGNSQSTNAKTQQVAEQKLTFSEADKLLDHPRMKSFDLEFGRLDLSGTNE